jgi:hypothetical protein
MSKISPLKCFWVGIRAKKIGNAKKYMDKMGFWKLDHGQMNNVGGFDFIAPIFVKRLSEKSNELKSLAEKGLVGIAIEFTDFQWEKNENFTRTQWQNRLIIGE